MLLVPKSSLRRRCCVLVVGDGRFPCFTFFGSTSMKDASGIVFFKTSFFLQLVFN